MEVREKYKYKRPKDEEDKEFITEFVLNNKRKRTLNTINS